MTKSEKKDLETNEAEQERLRVEAEQAQKAHDERIATEAAAKATAEVEARFKAEAEEKERLAVLERELEANAGNEVAESPRDIVCMRPSGLEITLKATKEMMDYAKKNGWEPVREAE